MRGEPLRLGLLKVTARVPPPRPLQMERRRGADGRTPLRKTPQRESSPLTGVDALCRHGDLHGTPPCGRRNASEPTIRQRPGPSG